MRTNGISHRILSKMILLFLAWGSLLLGTPQQAPEKLEVASWLQVVQPTLRNANGGSIGAGFSPAVQAPSPPAPLPRCGGEGLGVRG